VAVPNVLMGFRLEDPAAARESIVKLEMLLNIGLSQAPPQFQGVLKRETVAGHEYLVLRLNGKMIPWEGNEAEKLQQSSGLTADEAAKLIEHVKGMTLVIGLGVRENYLLATIGSTTACIEKLGRGEMLMNLPQFEPLKKFANQKLTSISFAGEGLQQAVGFQKRDLDRLPATLAPLLARTGLSGEKIERIQRDVKDFVEDVKGYIPRVGAEMAFSFLADQGIETYDYQWGEYPQIDGSLPLDLLEHVGGNPILGYVSRAKTDVKDYDLICKWLATGWKYFNEYAVPEMKEQEREKFEVYVKDVMPLLERLDKANRESMIPALADGQSGLVFDGKFTSKRLQAKLPEWEKPMPLPELGLVLSVSDAKLLKRGVSEYFAVAGDLIDVIRKHDSNAIPPSFKLPASTVTEAAGQTIYSYPPPSECGMDKNVVPSAGLSDKVAVLSLSLQHTERLLKKTPLAAGGVLEKTDLPRASAAWFNWAGLLGAATPWIDYGLAQIDEAQLGGNRAAAVDQVHVLLDVLKCLRSVTAESRLENGCLVTHSLLEIRDAAK
jgi:hypothetical protein